MEFVLGFVGATLFGLLGTFFARSWITIDNAIKYVFSLPKPALRGIESTDLSGVGTDPNISPLRVVNRSCRQIVVQLLLQGVASVGVIVVIALIPVGVWEEEVPEGTLTGIFYAGVLGLLTRIIWWNWTNIRNLYLRIVKPPSPTVSPASMIVATSAVAAAASASSSAPGRNAMAATAAAAAAAVTVSPKPPNAHYLAAKPPLSPCSVIANGCMEIVVRAILQVVLLALLAFSLHQMFLHLK